MKYFDLHFHPTTKSFLSDENILLKKSPWKTMTVLGIDNIFGDILDSQSSLSQIVKGNVILGVATIVPMEIGFAKSGLIRKVIPIISPLDRDFVTKIKNKEFSYWQLFNGELHFFKKSLEGQSKVNLLGDISDIDESKINLILAIEGGHSFLGGKEPLKNLLDLKKSSHKFLYITLTHLTDIGENYLANHAYGQKLINVVEFIPNRYALSSLGKEFIDVCYSDEQGDPIFIDIKHMSLRARQEFYKLRKKKKYKHPIIASHIGVTGIPYSGLKELVVGKAVKEEDKIGVLLKKVRGIGEGPRRNRTEFNPWTINLFDEEIIEVLDSDGLIGINLDQRILGFTSRVAEWLSKPSKEYFQEQEFIDIFGEDIPTIGGRLEEDPDLLVESKLVSEEEAIINRRQHTRYLVNNILHIIKIGGEKAWKHICIGSDFDGLIDPINSCKSTVQFADLEKRLYTTINQMVHESIKENSSLDFHIYDLKSQVRDLMYENGKRFLEKNF